MASQLDDLRLPPLDLPKCAVVGCDEIPTERLPGTPTLQACKPHADRFRMVVAERDFADFRRFLSDQGITDEPLLTDGQEIPATRKCCVPGCAGDVISGVGFEPFKQPGKAWVCQSHYDAANYVVRRQNGERLIRELATRPAHHDPERQKRQEAIRVASAKHKGKPNYIENVCRELQRQRVSMLRDWLEAWNREGFRVESGNWFDAYQCRSAKQTIQRYISKASKPKVKPA